MCKWRHILLYGYYLCTSSGRKESVSNFLSFESHSRDSKIVHQLFISEVFGDTYSLSVDWRLYQRWWKEFIAWMCGMFASAVQLSAAVPFNHVAVHVPVLLTLLVGWQEGHPACTNISCQQPQRFYYGRQLGTSPGAAAAASGVDLSWKYGGQGQSGQAVKLFRRLEKLVLPSIFHTSLSSSMMLNLQSYPTTVLNERMWHFRGPRMLQKDNAKCCYQVWLKFSG